MSYGFARPIAAMLPLLSLDGWSWRKDQSASVFLSNDCFFLHGARYALLSGLQAMGVKRDAHVLLPAYHCYSMVEPFVKHGCHVEFYKLKPDLSIDLRDLSVRMRDTTKAVLMTHYFAVPQAVEPVRNLLYGSDAILIEDCAHAFFGYYSDKKLGTFGDFSVASGKKFFPLEDGGVLKFNCTPSHQAELRCNPAIHDLKLLVNSLEKSASYGRLFPISNGVSLLNLLIKRLRRKKNNFGNCDADNKGESARQEDNYIDSSLIGRSGSKISRWIMSHLDIEKIRLGRIKNYNYLLSGLESLEYAQPLHVNMPINCVPYAFPLLLKKPNKHFALLKKAGVPMWRWEDVQQSHCEVSQEYRDRLIQLPCHQGLKNNEIEKIILAIQSVLNND